MAAPRFTAGENVLVSALIASIDEKKNLARLSIGWGPNRAFVTVPVKLLSKPLPKALIEAASWASDLYPEGAKDDKKSS